VPAGGRHAEPARSSAAGVGRKRASKILPETSSDDYIMELSQKAFSDGILRVGFAVNDLIVAEIKKGTIAAVGRRR
jgi:hypothetical protein